MKEQDGAMEEHADEGHVRAVGLDARFVKAWGEVENPALDGENPHFGNRFATLKATLGAVRKACAANGLAYVQRLARDEKGALVLESEVLDGEGGMEHVSTFPVLATTGDPQRLGSALTYSKRQQAQADWGITGEADDDAEAANGRGSMREAMVGRIVLMRSRLVRRGVKPEGLDAWAEGELGTSDLARMTEAHLVEYGKHLKQVEKDMAAVKGGREER